MHHCLTSLIAMAILTGSVCLSSSAVWAQAGTITREMQNKAQYAPLVDADGKMTGALFVAVPK
jgi:hypothetical protein